jgi:hypothetical protein
MACPTLELRVLRSLKSPSASWDSKSHMKTVAATRDAMSRHHTAGLKGAVQENMRSIIVGNAYTGRVVTTCISVRVRVSPAHTASLLVHRTWYPKVMMGTVWRKYRRRVAVDGLGQRLHVWFIALNA